jgi:hypothetical protein
MAELIRVTEKSANIFPAIVNGIAFIAGGSSIALSIAFWQEGDKSLSRVNAALALSCGVITETANRMTKSGVAIAQLVTDSEARLIARNIQAQEITQAADLSVASGKQLAELNLGKAHIDAETAIRLAELEAEYQNQLARLAEFIDLDKS